MKINVRNVALGYDHFRLFSTQKKSFIGKMFNKILKNSISRNLLDILVIGK